MLAAYGSRSLTSALSSLLALNARDAPYLSLSKVVYHKAIG